MKQWEELTITLLAHKYRYYILCKPIIGDREYDMMERDWVEQGIELGIDMDMYPNWVDFDENHPLAAQAIESVKK